MKNIITMTLCLLVGSPAFAAGSTLQDKTVMNIFELGIKAGKSRQYDEVARSTISSSLEAESGTLAMYSLKRKDDLNQAYMIEIYAGKEAYKKHVDSEQYKAFIERAPEIIDQKSKTDVTPQFLGDKQIVQNERTINNLVIVDVKPEHQQAFKNIVLAEMSDSLKIEDGVLAMYAATDAKNENRWYFYEIYASEADYQRHRQTPHFRGYIAQTSEMTTAKESIPVVPVFLRNKGAMQFDD
ncbi:MULTISPECIES: putative quinol monooxygenase [Serratia]|uniref:putative quinol monooxygenase n=1 Tax=Serratia TaxID=613 RepID=UPI0002DBDC46|nr:MULTISPECIES: antibiotic biosynthesis monooxygenase [Serratia]UTN95680.1 antibiotic biosynthesis monooxygenase [Serratia plymuthica]